MSRYRPNLITSPFDYPENSEVTLLLRFALTLKGRSYMRAAGQKEFCRSIESLAAAPPPSTFSPTMDSGFGTTLTCCLKLAPISVQ